MKRRDPCIDAAKWRAEHAIRPVVVNRKSVAAIARREAGRPNKSSPASSELPVNAASYPYTPLTTLLRAPRPIVPTAFKAQTQ